MLNNADRGYYRTQTSNDHHMPNAIENWRDFFTQWPTDMNRRGIIVTSFGEQIPFSGFWTNSNHLLLERQTPDSLGARTIILEYAADFRHEDRRCGEIEIFSNHRFRGPALQKLGGAWRILREWYKSSGANWITVSFSCAILTLLRIIFLRMDVIAIELGSEM